MDEDVRKLFTFPPYWLVLALPWPEEDLGADMAEAAFALAPACVPKKGLPKDVYGVLRVADIYAREHSPQRMVWFTDLTRWLDSRRNSWADMGVDWEHAHQIIPKMQILGIFMTISLRAYNHLVDAARRTTIHYYDGTAEMLTAEERQAVHSAFTAQLDRDWPAFIDEMIESGRLTVD